MTPRAKALLIAVAAAIIAGGLAPFTFGVGQTGPSCSIVYYTITSTITQSSVATTVQPYIVNGTTTTSTITQTIVQTAVQPGGVLANLSCSVPPPPAPSITIPSGPSLAGYPTDAFSILLAAVSIGAFGAAIVANLSRTVIYLFAAAAVVASLAAAYPPLAAVAQAGAALSLFAAVIVLALTR
jgi:hypothetical protein